MIRLSKSAKNKLDLSDAKVLLVGDDPTEQGVLAQMFQGFGATAVRRATATEAQALIVQELFDLALIEASSRDQQVYALLRSLRAQEDGDRKQTPVIVVRGHVRVSEVFEARDAGANLVLTKPVKAQALFDHVLWLAQDHRMFLDTDAYVGPDRRFKAFGPPLGVPGRRRGDLSETVGEPAESNLSQDAVDDFFSPKKASL